MRALGFLLLLAPLFPAAQAVDLDLDLDGGDGFDMELVAGERAAKAEGELRKIPPQVVRSYDFDNEKPNRQRMPNGWWVGIWGDRKASYGNTEGYGGKGRAMLVNIRAISGGEVQIFSHGWHLVKGAWYKITFKIRGFDHPGRVGFQVREAAGEWRSPLGSISIRPTNEWKEYSFGGCSGISLNPGQFGIMIGAGSPGKFAIDDVKVEMYRYNPFTPPKPPPPVPFTAGNLVPRGSFESGEDSFWCTQFLTADPHATLDEPMISRAEGGFDSRHCLRYAGRVSPETGKICPGGSVESLYIPVATGKVYRFSARVKASKAVQGVKLAVRDGNNDLAGVSRRIVPDGKWVELSCATRPIKGTREVQLRFTFDTGEETFIDTVYFGSDGRSRGAFVPATPVELDLGFVRDKIEDPRIVHWGEKLPLRVGAWPALGKASGSVAATLRVTAYPERTVYEQRLDLPVGQSRRIDVDPAANGVLRVELIPDDPASSRKVEIVAGRLPKPRATGAKGRFGLHMRVCPQILSLARAIGITWQRLHDCSPITKMSWGNPRKGEYVWFDREVDAMRDYGFSILGMPDYPAGWMIKEVAVKNQAFERAREKKKNAIVLPGEDSFGLSESGLDDDIADDLREMAENRDSELKSYKVTIYDNAAFSNWCEQVARHYRGRIDHFEIWNEPYMRYFYKGQDFGETFYAGLKGIRAGNPSAKVLGWCNEITTPGWCSGFIRRYPVEDKPDYNSTHYYYMGIPGDGDYGIERLVAAFPKTFGKYSGSEIWNTEGNLHMMSSFYSHRRGIENQDTGAAFGVRGWGESFYGGLDRVFIFGMFNCDGISSNWGLLSCADYDRSLNVWGAATATTAYFIDAMKPVTSVKSPAGIKLRVFEGEGRVSAYFFDDCLESGRNKFDPAKLPAGYVATDAMGTALTDAVELSPVPVFVSVRGVDPRAVGEAVAAALLEPSEKQKHGDRK